jgi:hypothetical protein
MLRRLHDEPGKVVGSFFQVVQIEDTFRQSPEESRVPILQHLPARTEQTRRRIELAPERQQVVFVSTGAMQKQQRAVG